MKRSLLIALGTLALGTAFSQASAQTAQASQNTVPVYGPVLEEGQPRQSSLQDNNQYRLPQLRQPATEAESTDCRIGLRRIGLRLRCGRADPSRHDIDRDPTRPTMSDMSGRRR